MTERIEIDVADAADRLEALIDRAHAGAEVIITRGGQPAARLVAIQPTTRGGRVPGSAKGLFVVPEDFDAPLDASTDTGGGPRIGFLDVTSIWAWCRERGLAIGDESGDLLEDPALGHRSRLVFAPGGASGLEPMVAAALLDALGAWDECLVSITGWGVWASGEDWPRYYALRGMHGEARSIDAAPGHLVPAEASADLRDLLTQAMTNGWDAAVLPARDGQALPVRAHLSHDGWVEVWSSEPVTLAVEGLRTES